jgi:predicted nuclease with TOPRIM domain
MGDDSPLVLELITERDQLKDKLAGLQEEQSELMADLTKAVGKVDVQEEVINTVKKTPLHMSCI